MSTNPRLAPAIPGAEADFGSLMAHAPEILGSFFELYAAFWQQGIVSLEIREMTRIRNARITDCGY